MNALNKDSKNMIKVQHAKRSMEPKKPRILVPELESLRGRHDLSRSGKGFNLSLPHCRI